MALPLLLNWDVGKDEETGYWWAHLASWGTESPLDYTLSLTQTVTQTVQLTPLPSTLILKGSGQLGLAGLRRFRNNAVDLTPFVGPLAVSASGFSGESAPGAVAVSSPSDLCQTTREEFLILFQSLCHQKAV